MRIEHQYQTWIYPEGHKVIGIHGRDDSWEVLQLQADDVPTIFKTFGSYSDALNFAIDLAREQESEG